MYVCVCVVGFLDKTEFCERVGRDQETWEIFEAVNPMTKFLKRLYVKPLETPREKVHNDDLLETFVATRVIDEPDDEPGDASSHSGPGVAGLRSG